MPAIFHAGFKRQKTSTNTLSETHLSFRFGLAVLLRQVLLVLLLPVRWCRGRLSLRQVSRKVLLDVRHARAQGLHRRHEGLGARYVSLGGVEEACLMVLYILKLRS